ncbi:MAG: class IV adenylate cyclase, partial [Patescibacteria group bacterium]
EMRQVDTYLRHQADKEQLLVIRIRRKEKQAILSFKAKSVDPKGDTAWHDYDTQISDPNKLEDILISSGYVYVCVIDKIRDSFKWQDFEINIDNIRDLGLFIEIEAQGQEKDIEPKKKEMSRILEKLGIAPADIIEKGYVALMLEAMAVKR